MSFFDNRFDTERDLSSVYLKIFSFIVMLTAAAVFSYFFVTGNFHIRYIVSVGCLFLFLCGVFIALFACLVKSEKSTELTYQKSSRQVKRLGWLSLSGFYISSLCLFAGLIFFAQHGDTWRNSIIFFTGSILSLITCLYGLIQRKMTKQHYELKKQQQEIIDLLHDQKLKEKKDITGGALLA